MRRCCFCLTSEVQCGMVICVLTLVMFLGIAARAQVDPVTPQPVKAPDDLLWHDNGYGISIQLPEAAMVTPLARNPEMAEFTFKGNIVLTLIMDQVEEPLPLTTIFAQAIRDAMFGYSPAARVEDDTPSMPIAGRKASRYLLLIGEKPQDRWLYGHAMTLFRPDTVLSVQIKAPASEYERALELFDRFIAGIMIQDPRQRIEENRIQLDAAQQWLESLDAQTLDALADGSSWQRILHGDNDRGYRRLTLRKDQELGLNGHRLVLQSRESGTDLRLDTLQDFFLSQDLQNEVWSMKLTARRDDTINLGDAIRLPQQARATPLDSRTWTDTGLQSTDTVRDPMSGRIVRDRSGNAVRLPQLKVTREVPVAQPIGREDPLKKGTVHHFNWRLPPIGYLSQTHQILLPWLLERQAPDMMFYTYHTGLAMLTRMTVRVEDNPETGGFTAWVRPSPRHPEQPWHYDKDGRLLEIVLDGTRKLVPSTAANIKALWDGR